MFSCFCASRFPYGPIKSFTGPRAHLSLVPSRLANRNRGAYGITGAGDRSLAQNLHIPNRDKQQRSVSLCSKCIQTYALRLPSET